MHKAMTVPSDTKYLTQVRKMLDGILSKTKFSETEKNHIILAVDEATTNIMEHAVDNNIMTDIQIEIVVKADNTKCEILLKDSGKKFDPTMVTADINIKDHIKKGKKHGLGIFLIRQVMDELQYTYRNGEKNELRMVKYIKQ